MLDPLKGFFALEIVMLGGYAYCGEIRLFKAF